MGVRIGDPLGIAFETMNTQQILQVTGPAGVTTFWSPEQRSDAPAWAQKLRELQPGDFSDDTQMTFAGARSLIRVTQLDLENLASAYIEEMNERDLGWGGTTVRGLREIEQWLKTDGRQGRSPRKFAHFPTDAKMGYGYGCGNGVAMRIAPMALLMSRVYNPDGRATPGGVPVFQQMIWDVGGLTHPDPRASIGAYAVASFIARLAARHTEPVTQEELLRWLSWVIDEVIAMEVVLGSQIQMPVGTEKISSRLTWMQTMLQSGASVQDLRTQLGSSSYTLESVPFSLATFLRHPTDFRAALKEAVEAGGDTDTNAAIVGSLVGANVGLEGIPSDWRNFRHDFVDAEDLGGMLYALSEDIRLAAGSKT